MTESPREVRIEVRGESVPVWIFESGGSVGTDLLFLHGYARDPRDYRALLEGLNGHGHRIVAPFLFANGGLRRPPTHFWACAALARRTIEALRTRGLVATDAPVLGHSTGGAVALTMARLDPAPPAVIGINPVQPAGGHPIGFMLRSAWMNTKMTLGLAGSGREARAVLREGALRFYGNWFRKPVAAYRLIRGLQGYDYDRLERWYRGSRVSVPAHVVYGNGDEFYPRSDGLRAGLERSFEAVDVRILEDENSHEWLMFHVARAVDEVERALGRDRGPEGANPGTLVAG